MNLKQWFALGVLASLPLASAAQQSSREVPPPRGALEASAPATDAPYVSALANYPAAADEQESPDEVWRAANDVVGRLGGHAGHIKGQATPVQAAVPQPMPSRPQGASMGHGAHHH